VIGQALAQPAHDGANALAGGVEVADLGGRG
jgi:hypothetical protein